MRKFSSGSTAILAITAAAALLATGNVTASPDGGGAPVTQDPSGFRFGAPDGALGFRFGVTINREDSDIFAFIQDQLTVEKGDLNGFVVAIDYARRLNDRADIVFGLDYSGNTHPSEYRDYVDQDDIPIVQNTRLTQAPLTVSLRFYLTPRGRQVGQFAWVPSSFLVYVGGGGGATWYRLEQNGEFVDFRDLAIFEDVFVSDGWTFAAHALAGLEMKLSSSVYLAAEGRYYFASSDLTGDFVGFEPIDLNGFRITAGLSFKL